MGKGVVGMATSLSSHPLLLACSPRQGGNSDTALALLRETLYGQDPAAPPITFLREHPVLPCISCGHCERHPGQCPQRARDASGPLFHALETAPALMLAAPVYFYHLPAQFKALIDRSQAAWMLRYVFKRPRPPRRSAHVILVAARQRGEKLFDGSLLTLKYWLDLFGFELSPPLTLYGLEGPGDLAADAENRAAVARCAASIREACAQPGE